MELTIKSLSDLLDKKLKPIQMDLSDLKSDINFIKKSLDIIVKDLTFNG